jgi:hypothetical protein
LVFIIEQWGQSVNYLWVEGARQRRAPTVWGVAPT